MDYDGLFSDSLTCKVDNIPLIAANGRDTQMTYHAQIIEDQILTRLGGCGCES